MQNTPENTPESKPENQDPLLPENPETAQKLQFEEEEEEEEEDSGMAETPQQPPQEEKKHETTEEQLAKTKDQLLRALADAENTRRRGVKDREDAGKYAVSSFARDLLDFSDNFSRAIQALPADLKESDERVANVMTGIEAMEKELLKVFEKHGIEKIEPLDQLFNPNFHEVMFEAPNTGKPAGTIVQIIEPGYILKKRLLRPARVGVAAKERAADTPPTPAEDQSEEPGGQVDKEV